MSFNSSIEWTGDTWNPVTGCTKVSPGCKNCYAERFALRLQKIGQTKYAAGFNLTLHPTVLYEPYNWKSGRVVFVCSMSDLFHEKVPADFIIQAFQIMADTPRHIYQILTKRPERLLALSDKLPWPDNIWMGVSVESARYINRIDILRQVPASTRFLSLEPLLGPLPRLNLDNIHWVIVGGESGPGARPLKSDWVHDVKSLCDSCQIPFFFKQWGGVNKKRTGRLFEGRTWSELPHKYSTFA